ncbi:MAG TPA: CRTAC1 family protein [Planctomycetota bacterium]|nr:CRTAC1 family protein [Planctomycetota bacterium]
MNRSLSPLSLLLASSATAQTFTDVAPALGWPNSNDSTRGLAWADYDGDGDFDVYLQNQGSTSRLLRNDGAAFADVTASMAVSHASSGWSAAWGDFDRDGKPDLYLGNFAGNNLFKNNFPAAFTDVAATSGSADSTFAQGITWIDHDRDGDLDLYVTKELDPFRFFRNNGNGTFTDLTVATGLGDPQSHGYGLTWGDFDLDGDFDCFVSNCGPATINRLFRNNQIGTGSPFYTEIAAAAGVDYQPNTYGADWADFDEDGDLDLFVAGAQMEPNHLYRNDGVLPMVDVALAAGVFGPPTNGHGCDVGDFDNDGWLDVYVQDFAGVNRLYRNLGGLAFAEVPGAAGASLGASPGFDCAFVDYDDDGDLDIHATSGFRDRLYQNSGNGNHWLQVVAKGTVDNRSAIGVTVEIVLGTQHRRRLLNASAGAFSQNLLPAHFGLGSATLVDQVIVHWLDGTTDSLAAVAADERITVLQSSGAAAAVAVGTGCANSLGATPALSAVGLPVLGNAGFGFLVSNAPPAVPVALFLGPLSSAGPLPLPNGCAVHLDLAAVGLLASGATNASGAFVVPVAVPGAYAFVGLEIGFQALVLDSNGPPLPGSPPLPLTLTNGLRLRLGY